jgi:exonuclease VII large subunit
MYDLNSVQSQLKAAEEKLKTQEIDFKQQLEKSRSKQVMLEEKLKELENFLITNRTYNISTEKNRPIKNFTNKIEAKTHKAELILLKDES